MRPSLVALLCTVVFALVSGALGYRVDPNAMKPPAPPPPPPFIQFRNLGLPPVTATRTGRAEVFELIAPNQIQSGFSPSLSLGNPDFSVGYRPQQTRPSRPQRPQQTFRPQRPQSPPQPQRPQQQRPSRPQRPFSQVVARPPVPVPPRPQG